MNEREEKLESELKQANLKISLLEEKVDALIRLLYVSKSEKVDPNQLTLLEDVDPKKEEAPVVAEVESGAVIQRSGIRGPRGDLCFADL